MREVWGWDFGDLSTVTVHIRRLRGKVETDPARPRLIRTVWGVGYRLDLEEEGPGTPADADRAGAGDRRDGADPAAAVPVVPPTGGRSR